jgi:hypothetical protein
MIGKELTEVQLDTASLRPYPSLMTKDQTTAIRPSEMPSWPERILAHHLHTRRGHGTRRWKVGEAMRTGGLSLIFGYEPCNCLIDATDAIAALLDAGYVVVPEQEDGSEHPDEDAMWSWLALREAGAIDPDAPWPFPVEFG